VEIWTPIKFDADGERAYANQLLGRFVPLGRLANLIGAAAFIGYQFWDFMLDPLALSKTGPLRLLAVLHFLACFGLTFLPVVRLSPRGWQFLLVYSYCGYSILFALILARLPDGFVAGTSGWLLGMIFIPLITNGVLQALFILVPQLIVTLLGVTLLGGTSFELLNIVSWLGGGFGFVVAFAYLLDVVNRRAYQLECQLEDEKRRSEALLLNILPVDIATRLKAHEEPLADTHDSVSVLFADLAGFTDISRKMSAKELVDLLNDLFSRFDKLAEQYGAEKIKTIGDAYMVATGLTGSVADHAEKIAELALGMRQAFGEFREENDVDLKLRIGVHSGAVVAGVIGRQKFSYDLWGDTVNVASRMESEGIPDQIQISAETWKLVQDRFQTTSRGEITIKGHRPREAYLLKAKG
jgi:adenylate cyclase